MPKKLTLMERITGRTRNTTPVIAPDKIEEASNNIINVVDSTKLSVSGVNIETLSKQDLYSVFDKMDGDPTISAALDLFADNVAIPDSKTGHVISVSSSDTKFKDEINELLWNELDSDTEAWEYTRELVKYGTLILEADTSMSEWLFNIRPKSYEVSAYSKTGRRVEYYSVEKTDDVKNSYFQQNSESEVTVYEKNKFISSFLSRKLLGSVTISRELALGGEDKEAITEDLYEITGKSILLPVIDTWKTLQTLESQLVTYRLAKSNVFKLVQVNVDGTNNKEAKLLMEKVKNSFKTSESIDMNNNQYSRLQNPIPNKDFVFVATKGGKGSIVVNDVGTEVGAIDLSDINYFRNKLHAGLGVLKAYLGWEETTPGGLGTTTLTKLDERSAKRVKRLQQAIKQVYKEIVEFYWTNSGIGRTLENMPKYEIIMGSVSTAEKDERQAELTANLSNASSIKALSDDFADLVNKDKLFKYLFEDVLNIDISHIDNSTEPEDVVVKYNDYDRLLENTGKKFGTEDIKTFMEKIYPSEARYQDIKKTALKESKTRVEPITRSKPKNVVETKYSANKKELLSVINKENMKDFFTEHRVYVVDPSTNEEIEYGKALDILPFNRKLYNEATYDDLKQATKNQDPVRFSKSKKLTGKYTGLDDTKDHNITFEVTAEDPAKNASEGRPTSYQVKVRLKDLANILSRNGNNIKDADIVREALKGNVAVSCTCPAAKYWGMEYNGTKKDYSININNIEPTRNPQYQVVCKHTYLALQVLPFYWNTIVKDLRAIGLLGQSNNKPVEEPKVEPQETPEEIKAKEQEELNATSVSEEEIEKELDELKKEEIESEEN